VLHTGHSLTYDNYRSLDFKNVLKIEICTKRALDATFIEKQIVPNTTNIKFPVTMSEYHFPSGVFASANNLLHTDKEYLRIMAAIRSFFPGTGLVALITGISIFL
jgi:hypothetical protein